MGYYKDRAEYVARLRKVSALPILSHLHSDCAARLRERMVLPTLEIRALPMLSSLQNLSNLPVLPVFGKVSALPILSRLHSNCTARLREYMLTACATARLRNASARPMLSRLQNISSLPAPPVLGNVRARPILPAYKECKHVACAASLRSQPVEHKRAVCTKRYENTTTLPAPPGLWGKRARCHGHATTLPALPDLWECDLRHDHLAALTPGRP
jgi:hypothetical protein